MKKKLVTIITFLVSITLFSQDIDHTWNYPIKPGTKEWQNLKTPKERINAYNIPDSILYKISTKNLVKSCLNYPDMIVIMHRDDLQSGYNYLKTLFNGFEELEKRPDAGKELIEVYKKMNPEDIDKYDSSVEKGRFIFKFTHIELILAQSVILKNLSNKEIIDLLNISTDIYQKKREDYRFAKFGIFTTAMTMGHVLDNVNYLALSELQHTHIYDQNLINNTGGTEINNFDIIYEYSIDYLNKSK